ncbi:Tol biopolymer transport system component [Chitinivorax tropicus]|uniref:Tricorn protease homolog n=1 Tax=Chitinivorax tropicus TaxID=714531 RepID=A0A840MLY8_9PROT|nr:S41 family peptidase [Chitinivorax tropicus]MBB5017927.1 Tol biopolymer transport system component [Chitinivorax tropicus]
MSTPGANLFQYLSMITAMVLSGWAAPALAVSQPLAYEPTLSPDGSQVAFVSGGDIWLARTTGGVATPLVTHAATDSNPVFSPDGRYVAFSSSRTGNGDVYLIELASKAITRLTYDDRPEQPSGWSADSKWLYFHSTSHDIQRMNDIYRIATTGGQPMPVMQGRYVEEKRGVPSPDGRWLAFNARGFDQWWRRGGAHIDQEELWLAPLSTPGAIRSLSSAGGHAAWPQWSADSKGLFYVGREQGIENLYYHGLDQPAHRLTQFQTGRVLWPSASANGSKIAFEREFQIWLLDVPSGTSQPLSFTLATQPAPPPADQIKLADKIEELRLSPDGRQLALIARGEVWLAPAHGGAARRLTQTGASQSQLAWSPDGQRLAYVSMRRGVGEIWQYDLTTHRERQLTQADTSDTFPAYSPDGKTLAFIRNGQMLYGLDLPSSQLKPLTQVTTGRPPIWADSPLAWSPDGRWLAWVDLGDRLYAQVKLIARQGGESMVVSQLASPGVGKKLWFRPEDQGYGQPSLIWQGEGRTLWWRAFQHAEQGGRWVAIDLAPKPPLGSDGEPQTGPWQPDAKHARTHQSLLPITLDTQYGALSADGKTFALVGLAAGLPNIWRWRMGETATQLTSTTATKHSLQLSSDGATAYYLEGGKPYRIAMSGGTPEQIPVQINMAPDFAQERQAVFTEAWRLLNDFFYDPAMHKQDWAALRERFKPWADQAQTKDELRRVMLLMIGELNSSHTGLSAPRSETQTTLGRLGVDFDTQYYEAEGVLKIRRVIPDSPAAQAGLLAGDTLLELDGQPIGADNLDAKLDGRLGKLTQLTVQSGGGTPRKVFLKPIPYPEEATLRYRDWVAGRRAYVDLASKGKLGYVHVIDMRETSLDQFHLDLDRAVQGKQGVIIDVRNNFGGMVDSWMLDTLSRRSHFSFTARQLPTASGRVAVGQYTLEKPTALVTNKWTLSDGEVFTEGYRQQQLGKVIGEPGAGWVIFTSFKLLVDGSILRLPFGRVLSTATGDDLETGPRPVDMPAINLPGDDARDLQLDAAMSSLLGQPTQIGNSR